MDSNRKTAIIVGVLFIIGTTAGVLSGVVTEGILNVPDYLEKIAQKHSQSAHDIPPQLYDLWLDTLVKTVKEFDPDFNEEVELSWRLVLSSGITYMKFKYDK